MMFGFIPGNDSSVCFLLKSLSLQPLKLVVHCLVDGDFELSTRVYKTKSFHDYNDAFGGFKTSRSASSETLLSSPILVRARVSSSTAGIGLKPSWKQCSFCGVNSFLDSWKLVLAQRFRFDGAENIFASTKIAHRCTGRHLNWNRPSEIVLRRIIDFWNF